IRDPLVTGVQTCALPISRDPASEAPSKKNAMRTRRRSRSIATNGKKNASTGLRRGPSAPPGGFTVPRTGDGFEGGCGPDIPRERSEERRVGKGGEESDGR